MEKITKGHPLTQSPDFIKQNTETLKSLFPTIVKEGKIDFEELKALLDEDLETEDEYYRLTWAGKSMARREATKPSTATLLPCKEESKNWDTTQNIFIEGDNLEVLKLIQKSYSNKIKMIYIDPPYNTGKDFVYKDNYSDNLTNYLRFTGQLDETGRKLSTNTEADGRYHSNWLNMIYPRIILARNLLKDDGVILIHIDENEKENLVLILNEIFGEENNLGQIVWDKGNPKGDAKGIAYQHEYILCYIKNREYLISKETIQRLKKNSSTILKKAEELYSKLGERDFPYELSQLIKKYNLRTESLDSLKKVYDLDLINKELSDWIKKQDFSGGEKAYCKIDENGDVFQTVSMAWPNKKQAPDEYFIPLIHPVTGKECPIPERGWRFPVKTMKELLEKGLIVFGEDENTQPRSKYLLKENLNENIPSIIFFGGSDDNLFSKWKIPFENPKPFKFSAELIEYFIDENDIVMDFFAGSGTTGHAIYELSQKFKNLKFILIQLPELTSEKSFAYKAGFKSIAEIAKQRIRKAGEKIISEKQEKLKQLKTSVEGKILLDDIQQQIDNLDKSIERLDVGFKVFKLDSSNINAWDGDPEKLEQTLFNAASNIKENRTEVDILYEILLKYGLDLVQPIKQKIISGKTVFNIGGGVLFICLADDVTTSVADGIGKWKEELKPATCKVIFKDTGFTDVEKTNSIQILKRYGIEEVNTI
jgi:adenine-specific DNA-methyltransferase